MATEPTAKTGVSTMTAADPDYPLGFRRSGGRWNTTNAFGNREMLAVPMVGLIFSVHFPRSIAIQRFDAVRELRDAGGGFHTPIECECLEFLLWQVPRIRLPNQEAKSPATVRAWLDAIDSGRLLLATLCDDSIRRTMKAQAQTRNLCVGALATAVLIPYALPAEKAAAIAIEFATAGKPLFTFADDRDRSAC